MTDEKCQMLRNLLIIWVSDKVVHVWFADDGRTVCEMILNGEP